MIDTFWILKAQLYFDRNFYVTEKMNTAFLSKIKFTYFKNI